MHECLQIPEVARAICDKLDTGSSLSVALTCRSLLGPGLDRVWNRITSFKPLISCLPPDIWQEEDGAEIVGHGRTLPTLRFTVTPTQVHLKRYLTIYARRIRVVHFGSYQQSTAVSSFLQALQIATNYEYGSLTPLLRTFAWPGDPYDRDDLVALFSSLFIGDSVESLVFNQSLESQAPKVLSAASIYMHTKRLRLKSLEATSTSGPGKTEGVVLPYLLSQAWDHLKSLTLDWCRQELMDHLASLPRLQNLAFKEFGTDLLTPLAQGQPTISPSAFQFLRVLSVQLFDSRGPIRHLLKWIPPSNEICELHCSVVVASKTARRQDTIHDISRFCNPCTLGHLSSTDGGLVPGDFGYLGQEEEPTDPDEAEEVDISSLYQFTSLRSLMLLWNFSHIRLTHQDASLISTSWPLIQCLDLCPRYPSYGRTPGIDHTDLLKILGGCPSLRYLGLRFDTTRIKGHDDNDSVSVTSRLKILEVGESPIYSPSQVAGFLKAHAPYLEKLSAAYHRRLGLMGNSTTLDRRWSAVVEALGVAGTQ